ncbi:MAG: glutaredoxin family protein [Porticoccaceae bacterium]|jgi:glutaredoxin|nr:glutaredoxin family protein [Porticoccaceae bacterium]MBT7563936.1 glutaredoxin family protein [Porticoccaceae bacterium]MBT7946836.1 glutaredoxin family protein [Porticoccaceae bacterium]MDB2383597.1 glutaredoxin family protein [Porticoccaceae bacterium]MDB2566211.1 glutaredoxin family protein [Porticoccaceae bacterium]
MVIDTCSMSESESFTPDLDFIEFYRRKQLINQLTLLTGSNCHLCDLAKAILNPLVIEKDWELVEVSIHGNKDLEEGYAIRIPVVVFPDGSEKGWPFTAAQIRRLLQVKK